MALDSINEKLSLMEWCALWEPGLPMSPGTLGQDDQQQLLWDYPGFSWGGGVPLAFILDLNTRLFVYLLTIYPDGDDLSSMMMANLASRSGDMSIRFQTLVDDATP